MLHLEDLWFLPFLLYAETHYRFPNFFSLLYKREPEIIADAPHRVEPGSQIPLLIVVKDAHLFPCRLDQITTEIRHEAKVVRTQTHLPQVMELSERLSSFIIMLDPSDLKGWIEIDVEFSITVMGRPKVYHNDNHRFSSRSPLRVFLARHSLPRFPNLYLGDPHVHSTYTEDQVEFGSPLRETRVLAQAMGLSFFCVTDHSYDLDDRLDSYLENDPEVPKWRLFQAGVDHLNAEPSDCIIVRGEEVSCRNSEGRNIHLLLFGQREFVHGTGDSADRALRTESEFSLSEALALRSESGVAIAAHAFEPVPFLQRLLLGRGEWLTKDLAQAGLSGLQIVNGALDGGFSRGLEHWTHQLLLGNRLSALAGNDAHGNFNRYRQIGIPFLTMRESTSHIFGRMRTGVFVDEGLEEQSILRALGAGQSILTDGPIARVQFSPRADLHDNRGRSEARSMRLMIDAISTPEFGEVASVKVIIGTIGRLAEQVAFEYEGVGSFQYQTEVPISAAGADYARVEIWTLADGAFDGTRHFCLTNPVWLTGRPARS